MTGGSNISALKTALAAAEARATNAEAKVSDAEAEIAFLKLTIEKLRREMYGWRSERKQRLLDQLELQLDELEASATEDELPVEQAAAVTTQVKGFARRKPFPAHLPRERVVVPAPTACVCCGSEKLSKIGEDVTETPEVIPRHWKERIKALDGLGFIRTAAGTAGPYSHAVILNPHFVIRRLYAAKTPGLTAAS